MEKKVILKIAIKVLIYALTLLGGYLGISSLSSCSTSHNVDATGITRIHVTDTTYIKHNGFIRSKKYLPYE